MRIILMRKMNTLLGALLVTLFTFSLVVYPKEGVQAATAGLQIFWEVVLPSLLPFFVLSDILLGMGVVHFIGVLLEPLMRPVFNVPGVGAFALSMGLAAGYPMDAVITAKFRRSGMCSRVEGERLLSFTNTADPLFIFGAVAVGMFGHPRLGAVLGIAHYLSSFTVGFLFKYYQGGRRDPLDKGKTEEPEKKPSEQIGIWRKAVRSLLAARHEDGRPLGKLMGDAVKESMGTLLIIGGFIMLFSVLVKMLTLFGVFKIFAPVCGAILSLFGLDPRLAQAVFNGILEIDLGTMAAGHALAPLTDRAMIAGWIIAWSGLCVHGQVASVIYDTDIRMRPYMIGRMLHGVIACFYTWVLMGPLAPLFPLGVTLTQTLQVNAGFNPMDRMILSGKQLLLGCGLLMAGIFFALVSKHFVLVKVKKTKP